MANIIWALDSTTKANSHTLSGDSFSFEVKRLKDTVTDLEKLEINASRMENGQLSPLGTMQVDPSGIETGLTAFRKYGVMLSRQDCIEIAKCLLTNYYSFDLVPSYDGSIIDDDTYHEILTMLSQLIEVNQIEPQTVSPRHLSGKYEIYPIPLKLFNEEVLNRQWNVTPKAIQEYLNKEGLTLVSRNCLEYVVPNSEGKGTQKCICPIKGKFETASKKAEQEDLKA